MAQTADDFVPVPRHVLENLQRSAALGDRVRDYGGKARDIVVAEAKAAPSTMAAIAPHIGVGALVAVAANMDEFKNSETVKKHWWLLPLAILALGYIMRRRESPNANAVLAVGGMLFVQAYRNRPKEDAKAAKSTDTSGPTISQIPTMHPIDERTAWIQSGGQWVRVQLTAPPRPALPMQTTPAAQTMNVNDPAVALAAAAFAA